MRVYHNAPLNERLVGHFNLKLPSTDLSVTDLYKRANYVLAIFKDRPKMIEKMFNNSWKVYQTFN